MQGWEEIRKKRRPCSSSGTFRSLGRVSRRKTSASGRFPPRNQQCGKVLTYNRADLAAGKKKYIYLPSSLAEEKVFTVPPRRRKIQLPSRRPAVGENIYLPVPPGEKIFTVPSRRRETYLTSRPVVKICPAEFYRPVPSRNYAPAVPSRPPNFFCFILPSRCVFFPCQTI